MKSQRHVSRGTKAKFAVSADGRGPREETRANLAGLLNEAGVMHSTRRLSPDRSDSGSCYDRELRFLHQSKFYLNATVPV